MDVGVGRLLGYVALGDPAIEVTPLVVVAGLVDDAGPTAQRHLAIRQRVLVDGESDTGIAADVLQEHRWSARREHDVVALANEPDRHHRRVAFRVDGADAQQVTLLVEELVHLGGG